MGRPPVPGSAVPRRRGLRCSHSSRELSAVLSGCEGESIVSLASARWMYALGLLGYDRTKRGSLEREMAMSGLVTSQPPALVTTPLLPSISLCSSRPCTPTLRQKKNKRLLMRAPRAGARARTGKGGEPPLFRFPRIVGSARRESCPCALISKRGGSSTDHAMP